MGVDAARVAEIIVKRSNGSIQRGSGYLVRTGRVLTVHHVLSDAVGASVRFDADRPGERTVEATLLWADAACDLAVLGVPDDRRVAAAKFGRIDPTAGRVECRAVGFPAFKLRSYPDGGLFRDSHDAHGHIAPLSNRREGTLELIVAPPSAVQVSSRPKDSPTPADDDDGDARKSPWAGMSGAAVWVAGRIVGVVSLHHPNDGLGTLAAERIDMVAERLADGSRLDQLERLLKVRLQGDALAAANEAPNESPQEPSGRVLVTGVSRRPAAVSKDWHGGAEVVIGGDTYMLLDGHIDNRLMPGPPVQMRQAQGLRIAPRAGPGPAYAWLRRAENLTISAGASRGDTRADGFGPLEREHQILTAVGRVPGLPEPMHLDMVGPVETLALRWPTGSTREPSPTLRQRYGSSGGPLDAWRLGELVERAAELCVALARLHGRGVAHRALTQDELIVDGNGRLVLRDLGLAAWPPRRGERPDAYQAPEQRLRHRGVGQPGPSTDVYRLAAIIYDLAAGRPPMSEAPLPVAAAAPDVSVSLGKLLDASLCAEPAGRPSAAEFAAALGDVRD